MSVKRARTSELVPKTVRRAFELIELPTCLEQRLIQEIVARAVLDACGQTGLQSKTQHDRHVREARIWFKFGDNVEMLLELAGLDYETVRPAMLKVEPRYKGDVEVVCVQSN